MSQLLLSSGTPEGMPGRDSEYQEIFLAENFTPNSSAQNFLPLTYSAPRAILSGNPRTYRSLRQAKGGQNV